ncbi:DNA translocase FtsK [Fructilactobacillus vespulae]|uniref:DNA translocase FtsK n=1 Tax=Fructilactobacillus vespulae TaxID=1249630 RepID=UPI0039B5286A
MATKRKRKTKGKKKQKLNKSLQQFISENRQSIVGLGLLFFGALACFNLGVIGITLANLVRIVFGNTYQVVWGLLAIWGAFLFVDKPLPKIKAHFIWGFLVSWIGILLEFSILMFLKLHQFYQYINVTWQTSYNDLVKVETGTNVGGGLIGSGLLQGLSVLISFVGTEILAVLIILAGIIIFCDIPITSLLKKLMLQLETTVKNYHEKRIQKKAERAKKAKEAPSRPNPVPPIEKPVEKTPPTKSAVKEEKPTYVEPKPEIRMANKKEQTPFVPQPTNSNPGSYQLPSTELLTQISQTDQTQEYNSIDKNTKVLQSTLKSFGVDAEIKNVSLGPSVTEYELHPAIGVKVSKIVNLSDDLALALAAKDIRIEAPIPGKSLIGIEVPNREVSMVSFRDTFESQGKQAMEKILKVPLGKDVNGNVISCDITKMPHLLIAGSTGSGKSVAINGFLTSILLKATPDQVKLMLIDPKKVELGVYNGIPHLLSPVVSDPKKAARALNKAVEEMENRYELFAKTGQRKIDSYNEFVDKENQKKGTAIPKLPYIVVVVDELADLMMTVSNEVETAIIRLAQMGRAAGVHMILATQRPSVDVITGLIKANVPSRIAFAVSSGTDSRTILDSNGAEKLLGRGDMLFEPIGQNKPNRVQGSFISDTDVESIVEFVKSQGEPDYDDKMVVTDEDIAEEQEDEEKDDLFDEALDFVVEEHKASTSMLQRRFRIGYNRAARIVDEMEQRGYVGPQRGSVPRTVYKQKDPDND